jgi:hypothetical protein
MNLERIVVYVLAGSFSLSAFADEDLLWVDNFVDPSLRGASLCLPRHTKVHGEPSVINRYLVEQGCAQSKADPQTILDLSAGAAHALMNGVEFLNQDAGYVSLVMNRYFEAGKSAQPFDVALSFTHFEPWESNSSAKILENRILLQGGHYSLFNSTDGDVATSRSSLRLTASTFETSANEYVASWMTQVIQQGRGYGELSFDYQWGREIPEDFRARFYFIYDLASRLRSSAQSRSYRLQGGLAFGGGLEEGRIRALPISAIVRGEYDLSRTTMIYGGYSYSHQFASHGREQRDNSSLQVGFYMTFGL